MKKFRIFNRYAEVIDSAFFSGQKQADASCDRRADGSFALPDESEEAEAGTPREVNP
jgi:hypothetical protein